MLFVVSAAIPLEMFSKVEILSPRIEMVLPSSIFVSLYAAAITEKLLDNKAVIRKMINKDLIFPCLIFFIILPFIVY